MATDNTAYETSLKELLDAMQELLDTAANDTTNDLAVVETSLLQLQATLLAIDAVSSAVFEDLANGAAKYAAASKAEGDELEVLTRQMDDARQAMMQLEQEEALKLLPATQRTILNFKNFAAQIDEYRDSIKETTQALDDAVDAMRGIGKEEQGVESLAEAWKEVGDNIRGANEAAGENRGGEGPEGGEAGKEDSGAEGEKSVKEIAREKTIEVIVETMLKEGGKALFSGAAGGEMGGGLKGGVAAVGIAWVAVDVLRSLNNKFVGKIGDEGYTPGLFDWKEGPRAKYSQQLHENLQEKINQYATNSKLVDNNTDLYRIISMAQNSFNADKDKHNNNTYDLLGTFFGYNKYGELNPHTNADAYNILVSLGYKMPNLSHPAESSETNQREPNKKEQVSTKPEIYKKAESNKKGEAKTNLNLRTAQNSVTGQQVKTYNITIGSLIKDFRVETNSVKEAAPDIRRVVIEALTDALNDSQVNN